MQCSRCQSENPAGMKFCGQCGAPLLPETGALAELRQLTVVFCDLVGSTVLADSMDPEELREITSAYHAACGRVIARHEGHIAQYLGDGILAYFGYPVAHEDDARRAVRTGLGIIEAMREVSARWQRSHRIALSVRIGIHTGPVVVGEVGGVERREHLALGRTPNLAARIQNLAAPGTIAISEDTRRLVRGYVDVTPLGTHDIRGLAERVTLYQVTRESGAETRLEAARGSGLTDLTGRQRELGVLESCWSRLRTNGAHTVLLEGEAGIGKSRIVDALRMRVADEGAACLESVCTPYAQGTALFPLSGMFERTLGFTRETTGSEKHAALEATLREREIHSAETHALLAHLLGIPVSGEDPTAGYQPQKRRELTMGAALAWIRSSTRHGPALWVVEDLHWSDPTTLEFVTSLMHAVTNEPLLVILTFRPDFASTWAEGARLTRVALDRLDSSETERLAVRVAGGKRIPEKVLEQVVARTEGIPLFVEEVTKAVLELGVLVEKEDRFELQGPLPPDLIPSSVQGSLHARLDRLGPAKATAQLAATIGREFRYDLLRVVAPGGDDGLRLGLDRLLGAGLVHRLEHVPEETYLFKHALIQDAAYQSLLKKSRRELHGRIAEALLAQFPDTAQKRPELVAQHFTEAGRAEAAVRHWLDAGRLAVGRAANTEALAHIHRGIALLPDLPDESRAAQELELLMALVPALIASQAWISPELKRVYERAGELMVGPLGNTPHRLTVLAGLMGYHFVGGRVSQSRGLAEELLALALQYGDPLPITIGRQDCSAVYQYTGLFKRCVEEADAGLAMLDVNRERAIAQLIGLSSCVGLYGYRGHALMMMGYADQSKQSNQEGLTLATELAHSPSIAFAMSARADWYCLCGDAGETLRHSTETIRYCDEERSFWQPMLSVYRGWARSVLGEVEEGLAEMQRGFGTYVAIGHGVKQVQLRALLAEGLWRAGRRSEAFDVLAEAMLAATANGEGFMEPELYRLKGEFLAVSARPADAPPGVTGQLSDADAARAAIRTALDLARQQEARFLELRAATSLLDLERAFGGDVAAARAQLASVYDWFTEGMDLPDLQRARDRLATGD